MPKTQVTIEIDIPEGFTYVEFDKPKRDGLYVDASRGTVHTANFDFTNDKAFLVRKDKWRDATIDDVDPYNPKECRVRDDNYQEWRYRKLMGVVANTFFTATVHNLSGTYKYCQVKE